MDDAKQAADAQAADAQAEDKPQQVDPLTALRAELAATKKALREAEAARRADQDRVARAAEVEAALQAHRDALLAYVRRDYDAAPDYLREVMPWDALPQDPLLLRQQLSQALDLFGKIEARVRASASPAPPPPAAQQGDGMPRTHAEFVQYLATLRQKNQ